jgi:hypothetical protein
MMELGFVEIWASSSCKPEKKKPITKSIERWWPKCSNTGIIVKDLEKSREKVYLKKNVS